MASHLGMSLNECMSRVSQREYHTWQAWFRKEWNRPNRTDHYLMELICTVNRKRVQHPERIKPYPLKWTWKKPLTEEQQEERDKKMAEASMRVWCAVTGASMPE